MTPLRQKMIDAMLLRGFSVRTQRSYLDAVIKLSQYYSRSPEKITVDDLQKYFLYLVKERHQSSASCRLYLNACRFLYLQVLDWKHFDVEIQTPKRPQRIPELLSRAEVRRILNASTNTKHRVMLMTCYACGLRVSELVALQVKHIDSERQLLRIEQAKGAKDRPVLIGQSLLNVLRRYWQEYRSQSWLFYGRERQYPVSIATAQKAFGQAKRNAGVNKIGGIHSLRHAYATHQLQAGMPVHQLQRQLGHNHIDSTMRYVHWIGGYHPAQGNRDLLAALEV